MESPEKMLWAAALWDDVFFPEHAPHHAHDGQACAECLAEGTNFGRRCCIGAGELVHDVPCVGHEVVLVDVAFDAFDVEVAAILHGGHWGHGHGHGGRDGRC